MQLTAVDRLQAPTRIRVLIADHRPMVRHGMIGLLQAQPDVVLVGTVESGKQALAFLMQEPVDVLLLSMHAATATAGTAVIVSMRQFVPACAILLVSDPGHEDAVCAGIRAGAQGSVDTHALASETLRALRTVSMGGQAFPRRIADRLTSERSFGELSSRELEVLQLVASGLTNREVASSLHISQFTVRNHLNHITGKLEVSDRVQAVSAAVQAGMITPPGVS